MFSRIAAKLHSRSEILGDTGRGPRLFAWLRRPAGRMFLRRQGKLNALTSLGRRAAEIETPNRIGDLPAPGSGRRRIMVASLRAWPAHNGWESLLAHGLRLRGAEVSMLTCGGGQPLCEQGWARRGWPLPCDRCGWYTDRVARAARLPHYRLADRLPWGRDARNAPFEPTASPGAPDPYRAAQISVPWMLKSSHVDDATGLEMMRDFAVSAQGVAASTERALEHFRPDTLILLNGLFAAEYAIREMAQARGLRVITYELGPRENALVYSAGLPALWFHTDAAWRDCRERQLTRLQRSAIETMLDAREEGRTAHERYYEDPLSDPERVRATLQLPADVRVVTLFTNLTWDSAVIGRDLGYESMLHWILDTVRTIAQLQDVFLVIRVHPAEHRWGTREPVAEALGELPANVRLVPATQALSSYGLLALSDLALAYSTTVGLEAAARGIPVAVAGDTHYRHRGFTYDIGSPDEQRSLLHSGQWSISANQKEIALRYAFMFFFKCLIPFDIASVEGGLPVDLPDDPSVLLPGADPYFDFVCDRILDGGEFVLPDELALPNGAGT